MESAPEICVTVLPNFRSTLIRAESILVAQPSNTVTGAPTTEHQWRFPTKNELSRILSSSAETAPTTRVVSLFEIPRHLRDAWWRAAEEVTTAKHHKGPKFQSFIERLAEFLRYKRVPLAEQSRFDVIVAPPNGVTLKCRGAIGSRISSIAINLGDKSVDAVLANERTNSGSLDYAPLIRLTLEPGEGLSFAPGAVLHFERRNAEGETVLLLNISPDASVPSGAANHRPNRSVQ